MERWQALVLKVSRARSITAGKELNLDQLRHVGIEAIRTSLLYQMRNSYTVRNAL